MGPRLIASLHHGGRFVGHFLGENDSWTERFAMTFCSASNVVDRLGRDSSWKSSRNWNGTHIGSPKPWHGIEVVALKNIYFSIGSISCVDGRAGVCLFRNTRQSNCRL